MTIRRSDCTELENHEAQPVDVGRVDAVPAGTIQALEAEIGTTTAILTWCHLDDIFVTGYQVTSIAQELTPACGANCSGSRSTRRTEQL